MNLRLHHVRRRLVSTSLAATCIIGINSGNGNSMYKQSIIASNNRCLSLSLSTITSCDASKNEITLYQYRICPFCHRVRSLLDYLQIDYKTIEVDPLTKTELSFSKDYKKVPVAIVNNDVIGDSNKIIKEILELIKNNDNKKKFNMKEFVTDDTDEWIEWSEKKLAVMLYPNITRSFEESWETFAYVNDVKEWSIPHRFVVRVLGTGAMSFANKKIKEKYGIKDEREELKQVLNHWVNAVGKKKFLHGDKITVADLMVFGVLRSINKTRTFDEIMNNNTNLNEWYNRVLTQM